VPPPAEAPGPRSRLIIPAGLLLAYAAVVAWAFVKQATAWPSAGSWTFLPFVLFCPGILFQAVNLVFRWRTGRALTRGALVRLATIPAGLLLASALLGWAGNRAFDGFTRAYAPFVAEIGAHLSDPCPAATRAFTLPAVAAYNRRAGHEWPRGKLSHDGKRFVLSFAAASVDIDGSTLFFDSNAKAWALFHNDDTEKAAAYDHAVEGLTLCPLHPGP